MKRILSSISLSITLVAGAAAAKDCAAELSGSGHAITVSGPILEPERVSLSTMIYEALKAPLTGERPETLIERAPACPLGVFTVEGAEFSLSGGQAPLPLRWVNAADREIVFYLVPGRTGGASTQLGMTSQPHLLVGAYDRLRMVLAIYDGAPSDQIIKTDIAESFRDPEFVPLAAYDAEGDAVTVFRTTKSGVGAQLFGPPPSGGRTAAILLPDGQYFTPGPSGQAVMREANLPCPFELGSLTSRQLVVVEGSPSKLDLACQYKGDDVFISIFVERLPRANLRREFESRKSTMRQDYRNARETPRLVGVNGPTKFEHGASWLDENDMAGGIWIGRKGEFLIEVNASWTLDSYKDARDGLQRIDRLFFD